MPPTPAPLTPGYNQATLLQVRTNLAQRLGDPNYVYWSVTELNTYIVESLRFFQSLTGWYRETGTVNTLQYGLMGPYFDLSNRITFPANPSSFPINTGLLTYNVTDQQLLSEAALSLLETPINPTSGLWIGTEQFNVAQFYNALQNRIYRFMGDTGIYIQWINQTTGVGTPVYSSRLYSNVIDVRRASYVDSTGARKILNREDAWSIKSYSRVSYNPAPFPQYYSFDPSQGSSISWYPPANNAGSFELLYVPSGPTVQWTLGGTVLTGCPDDFCWAIKYGAMADLLGQDGEVRDSDRAAYCEQRYQQGVELAITNNAVQMAYLKGVPIYLTSSFEADHHCRRWVNQTMGSPRYAIVEGRCIVAFDVAITPTMNLSLDVIRNMPVPQLDADFLQCPNDVIDPVVDYAQHAASFKMGGQEFMSTTRLFASFMAKASQYNERIRQFSFYKMALRQAGITSLGELPRLAIPEMANQ